MEMGRVKRDWSVAPRPPRKRLAAQLFLRRGWQRAFLERALRGKRPPGICAASVLFAH